MRVGEAASAENNVRGQDPGRRSREIAGGRTSVDEIIWRMQWTHPSTGRQCAFGSAEKGPSAEVSAAKPMSTARAELITCHMGKLPYGEAAIWGRCEEGGIARSDLSANLSGDGSAPHLAHVGDHVADRVPEALKVVALVGVPRVRVGRQLADDT